MKAKNRCCAVPLTKGFVAKSKAITKTNEYPNQEGERENIAA